MHPLLILVVPAYLGAMALAIIGLSAAIVPAQLRRLRSARREVGLARPAAPAAAG